MQNILEDPKRVESNDSLLPLKCLPRARALGPTDEPHAWIVVPGTPLSDSVPGAVASTVDQVLADSGDSMVGGPILTSSGQWVVLVNPDADTRTGRAASIRAHAAAARKMRSHSIRSIVLGTQGFSDCQIMDQVQGLRLGWYSSPTQSSPQPPEILVAGSSSHLLDGILKAELFSQATCLARYWTEQPPNKLTPALFASIAQDLGEAVGLQVKVLGLEEMRQMEMGGVLAVGEGSVNSPRVVTLCHRSSEPSAFGIIGKGITFDSGGISLKPSKNLRKLKGDKAGASAVLAASLAAAQMDLDIPFLAVLPLAENMPSATAYRPGDVIQMLDGTTVDIVSTDAEGRMVLADGMVLASRQGCQRIVTLATLTRASMVALGNYRAAFYSSDEDVATAVVKASEQVGEFVWRMPLDEDYAHALKSPVADLLNSSEAGTGGSIVAAKFLQHFAHGTAWAHIDMSPIFFLDQEKMWGDKGYTGAGARLLLSLLENSAGVGKKVD